MWGCADMRVNLPYIMRDTDRHGNERVYLRKSGKKVRLRSAPGTPEFVQEYNQALGNAREKHGAAHIKGGSFRWLVVQYSCWLCSRSQ